MVKKVTTAEIIKLFLRGYDKKIYLREMAVLLAKPHQTVKPHLQKLIREKALTETVRKNITEYSLNWQTKSIENYLVIAEKEKLLDRLNEENILQLLFDRLHPLFEKATFIIFGSAVEKLKEYSDIDMLIVGKINYRLPRLLCSEFENTYNRKIHLITASSFQKITATLAKEICLKHLIFNNTEHVVTYFRGIHGQH